MSAKRPSHRPCERFCPGHNEWLHHSRFRSYQTRHGRHSTKSAGVSFARLCKACEQIERNKQLNEDRPAAVIARRAENRAHLLGVSREFFMVNMNWISLVPMMRALMSPEGRCQSCGHPFSGDRDIQIEHHQPPRFDGDWAREHARNLGFLCGSCNRAKSAKDQALFLDEQETTRIANEKHPHGLTIVSIKGETPWLFDP